jgi:membrane protein DedA with SNARE-associated domain
LTEDLIAQLGYVGFFLVLVLGGLGLPVPEEVPVILAAVLSRKGTLWWPLAFASCLLGVLAGDFLVYFLGYFYGEKVLKLPLTRKFLTKPREAQIKGYFHRHGIKILIVGRFAVGFRTAAYLTAGILKLPALRLFLTDLFAATLSTTLMFGLGYLFAQQIERATAEIHRWQHWITFAAALGLSCWLLYRFYRGRQRIGQPVGPPVLVGDAPLPPDDLHSGAFAAVREPAPAEPAPVLALPPPADDGKPAGVDGHGTNGEALASEPPRPAAGVGATAERLEEKSG